MTLPSAVEEFRRASKSGSLDHLSLAQRREAMRLQLDLNFLRFGRSAPELDSVTDHVIDSADGSLKVRLYRPESTTGTGAHMFLHGGGWCAGSIDDLVNDATCRERAAEAGILVVAVDYRLAPEHPFPAALEDARAAFDWLIGESAALGIDPANVSLGGNSAGANIAAALALMTRDSSAFLPVLQVLEVPVLDLTLDTVRAALSKIALEPDVGELELVTRQYLQWPDQALNELASPLRARDVSGLPPALIYTAEHDPVREDGHRYAERLVLSRVPCRLVDVPGALHGAALLTRVWQPAQAWQDDVIETLRRVHAATANELAHKL